MTEKMELEDAISTAAVEMSIKELKDKQRQAILTFVRGQDTFVSLPTGYGKSLIYALLPPVFDKVKGVTCWLDSCQSIQVYIK